MGYFSRMWDWAFGSGQKDLPLTATAPAPLALQQNMPVDTNAYRPVIGISGGSSASKSVAAMMSQIRSTGAEPVFLGEHASRIQKNGGAQQAVAHDLAGLDAIIVMGNDGDIDPAKYHEAVDKNTKVETDTARAAYEEAALVQAMNLGMPVLGVCAGMQRLNVLGGGSLYQHVPDIVGDNHHMQGDIPPFVPVQAVKINPGTNLAGIAGDTGSLYMPRHQALPPGVVMENSFHHQAVKKVRDDFQANAVSSDGIIEGIEPKAGSLYSNQYVMGVQWHPEFGASDLGPKIAASVTHAAQAYALGKEQKAEADLPPTTNWGELVRRQQDRVLANTL